jgi:biopolymer transport protein ExbD/biopolymer transport protein TolR
MMAFSSGNRNTGSFQPLAEMNVTPLVDVMLVLLIIFMVTAPMMTAGVKVNLPQARAAKALDPREPVVVTVTRDGKYLLGLDEVPQDRIVDVVRAKTGGDLAHVIHLRGDKDAAFGDIMTLMDKLSMNGMTHLAILSQQKKAAVKDIAK